MKKKLIILIMALLFTTFAKASDTKIKLMCKLDDTIDYSDIFIIDLENRFIRGFFVVDAYITSISDKTITAWIKGNRYSDGVARVTTFDRYSGKMTTGMMKSGSPTFQSWNCKKAPKKVF